MQTILSLGNALNQGTARGNKETWNGILFQDTFSELYFFELYEVLQNCLSFVFLQYVKAATNWY
jgi:hypothetical protein